MRSGRLRSVKDGGARFITAEGLQAYVTFYAPTTAGTSKRVYVHGRTRDEARDTLIEEQAKAARGTPGGGPIVEARSLSGVLARARR